MIELKNISKTFNKGTADEIAALKSLSLKINEGDFITVVGFNGSGKSTLLNLISGSLIPDSGEIHFNDIDVTKLPDFKRSQYISRIFQNPLAGTASELSIMENFRLAALRTKSKTLSIGNTNSFRNSVCEKLKTLNMGLENKPDALMGSLSGGQRQALTLLMSVMDESKILLLDEPTAALDPKSAAIVMELAEKIIRDGNLTALMVTHRMKDAINYGNRLIMMKEGLVEHDYSNADKKAINTDDLIRWFNI